MVDIMFGHLEFWFKDLMASLRDKYVKRRIPNYVNGAKVQTHVKSVKDLDPNELDYYHEGRNEPTPPDANYVSAVKQRKKAEIVIYEVAVDEETKVETTSKNLAAMFSSSEPIQSRSIPMAHDHKEFLVGLGVGFTSDGLVDVENNESAFGGTWTVDTADEVNIEENIPKSKRPGGEHRFEEKAEGCNGNSQTEVEVVRVLSKARSNIAGSSYSNSSTVRRSLFRPLRVDKEAEIIKSSSLLEASMNIPSLSNLTSPVLCGEALREKRLKREAQRQKLTSQTEDTSSSSKEVSPTSTYSSPSIPSRPFRAQRLREEAKLQNSNDSTNDTSFSSESISAITNLSGMDVSLDGIQETTEVSGKVMKLPNIQTVTEDGQWENVSSDFTKRNAEAAFVDLTSVLSDNWERVPSDVEGAQRVDRWEPEPVRSVDGTTGLREPSIFQSPDVQTGPSKTSTPKPAQHTKSSAKQAEPVAEEEWEEVITDFTKLNRGTGFTEQTSAVDEAWEQFSADQMKNKVEDTTDPWEPTNTFDSFAGYYKSVSVTSPVVKPGPSRTSTSNKGNPGEEPKSPDEAPKAATGAEDEWEEVTSDFTKQNAGPTATNNTLANDDWELPGTSKTFVQPPEAKINKVHADTKASKKKDSRFKIPLFTVPNLEEDPDKFSTAVVKRARNKEDIILVCVDEDVEESIIILHSEMRQENENGIVVFESIPKEGHYYGLRIQDTYGLTHYYRVQLLLLLVGDKAYVFCCDTGSEKIVPRSDLFQLRSEWTEVPQRAVYAQMYPGSEEKVIGTLEKDESFRAAHVLKRYKIHTFFTGNVRKYVAGGIVSAKVPRALVEFK